jgi:hypothetical protein
MDHDSAPRNRPLPWLAVVLAAVLVLAAGWILSRRYTSAGARECVELYQEARTAADTAHIDTTIVPGSAGTADPRSCGSMRYASRWQ